MNTELMEGIYAYIKKRNQKGVPPTIREICRELGIKSTSTAHKYVSILVDQGAIEKDSRLTRTLTIPGMRSTMVPLVGVITAGVPITAIQNIESYIPFSPPDSDNKELFALRVRGDSMIDAGIFEDDIVIIEKDTVAENGDYVAALIGDEATVKTFYKETSRIRLQPENPNYDPIYADDLTILGTVKSLVRNF